MPLFGECMAQAAVKNKAFLRSGVFEKALGKWSWFAWDCYQYIETHFQPGVFGGRTPAECVLCLKIMGMKPFS